MGTYLDAIGGTPSASSVCTLIGMESYGSMDALAETGGEHARLLTEAIGFFDQSTDNGGQIVLKKATEATTYAS